MLFRKRLFAVLAILSLAWIVYGFSNTSRAISTTSETLNATYEAGSAERAASNVGIGIGAGLSVTIFLCTGLPLFFFFALMAWRNSVGLRNERRHQEQIAAMQKSQ